MPMLLYKTFATKIAPKVLFSGMNHVVSDEAEFLSKAFATSIACKWFLSSVCQNVCLHATKGWHYFETKWTAVLLFSKFHRRMFRVLMVLVKSRIWFIFSHVLLSWGLFQGSDIGNKQHVFFRILIISVQILLLNDFTIGGQVFYLITTEKAELTFAIKPTIFNSFESLESGLIQYLVPFTK